eukprot:4312800-Amphidinium_carterae.5
MPTLKEKMSKWKRVRFPHGDKQDETERTTEEPRTKAPRTKEPVLRRAPGFRVKQYTFIEEDKAARQRSIGDGRND